MKMISFTPLFPVFVPCFTEVNNVMEEGNRLSEPDSDSFKVKRRETDDEGDDDEGREQGKLSIQARDGE